MNSITFGRAKTKQYFVYWYYQKETGCQWVDQKNIFRNWIVAQNFCNKLNEEVIK